MAHPIQHAGDGQADATASLAAALRGLHAEALAHLAAGEAFVASRRGAGAPGARATAEAG